MKLTRKKKEEFLKIYDTWMHSYLNGDVATYDSYFADEYHFIGSTDNEEFLNRRDTTQFFKNTAEQFSGKTELRKETTTVEAFDDLIFITHIFDAWFLNGTEWTYYSRFRFSSVLQEKKDGWKFIYQHFSIADGKADEGESIGFDKVNEENQELREAIKRRTIELEAKNRELEIEGALQRIRAQAVAMQQSSDLLDIVVTMRNEFTKLGHEAHYFWHMMWLPDKFEKAMTSGDGAKISMIMELPRDFHSFYKGMDEWESNDEPIMILPLKTDDAIDYIDRMVSQGDFQLIDPNAPTEDDLRHIGGVTFIMARTSHGEIGYSLPGVVKNPPKEDLDILVQFSGAFDLAHRRFLDLQKAEKQAREIQIELALEKVRSRTMGMQRSDELRDTAMLLFQQIEDLGINSFACGFNIWDDDKKAATAWMASKDRLQPPFKTNSVEDVYLLFLEAEKRGDSLFILEQKGKELEEHYKYLVTIPEVKAFAKAGLTFPTYQIIHCAYFAQGYLMFITYEPVTDAHDIFKRFAKVFEQTYTRFLDLQKAEEQVREAQIETALEKVRSRSLAVHKSEEFNEVVSIVFEKLKELQIPATAIGIGMKIEGSKDLNSYVCGENEAGLVITNYRLPYFNNKISKDLCNVLQNELDFYVGHYSKKVKDAFYKYVVQHTEEFKDLPEDIKRMIFESPSYTISMVGSKHSVFNINDFEDKDLSENEIDILKRFSKVFNQAYTRFLDLQKAEAQAREAQIETSLERVRSRTMAMQHSDEMQETSFLLDQQVRALGIKTWGCAFNIYGEKESTEWFGNEKGVLPTYTVPRAGIFKEYFQKGQKGESLFINEYSGKACVDHYEYMSSLPVIGDVLKKLKEANNGFPTYQLDHIAYFKYGYLLFITKEHVPDAHAVFKRFAKVFEQTYTRFLDLQKAEAQAKEAQIETALERVRSRSMAMHNSNEIGDVASVLFQQLKSLGGELWGTGFGFCEKESDVDEFWFANDKGVMPQLKIPNTVDPSHKQMYKGWKKNLESLSIVKDGKELKEHYKYMLTVPDVQPIFQDILDNGIAFPKWQKWQAAYFKYGYLLVITTEAYENEDIFKRFAKVFEQAYTRFLDLQKAEARAKEAIIETALERVRSQSMGMQTSKDFSNVTTEMFNQLRQFNADLYATGIVFCDKHKGHIEQWHSVPNAGMMSPFIVPIDLDYIHQYRYDQWKKGTELFSIEIPSDFIDQHFNDIFKLPSAQVVLKEFEANKTPMPPTPNWEIDYGASFNHGYLLVSSLQPFEEAEILPRFAKVFEQTYTRFLDLQKAEAQTKEAQIETALERVRSQGMAMHKSDELKEVVKVIFDQMANLKINAEHAGIMVDYEPKKDWHFWVAETQDIPAKISVPYLDNVWDRQFTKAKKNGKALFTTLLNFEEKNTFYNKLLPHIEGLTQEMKDHYFKRAGLAISTVIQKDIGLYIENFSGIPFSNEENNIVMRFAKVFQQTYTRFLDLQKAEAQTREAQIEAALERTRTQSMLMQHSDELNTTAQVFHEQLQLLGIDSEFSYLWLPDEDEKNHKFWATWSELNKRKTIYKNKAVTFPLDKSEPSIDACYIAWESEETVHVNAVEPDKVEDYFNTWSELLNGVEKFKPELFPEGLYYIDAYMEYGCFGIMIKRELNEDEKNILSRFSKEFQRTYTRFLDLQKAEAQTREAQIEAALEKIRSRTMAMQKGEEVKDVVVLLYKELIALGVTNFVTCGYVEINEETQLQSTWVTSPGGDSFGLFYLPLTGDVHFDARYKAWKKQQTVFHQTVAGQERRKHLEFAITTFNSKEAEEMVLNQFPDPTVFYCFNFSHGYLHLVAGSQLTKEEEALLARFTKVFEQTYARFLDLEKAAAQTREAQINLAVERVRAKALAMHKSEEIMEVVAKLKEEVMALDIPDVIAATIFLNEGDDKVRMWDLSTLEKDNNGYQIPFDITFKLKKKDPNLYVKRVWENPKNYFIEVQEGKDFKRIITWLRENNKDDIADEVKAYTETTKLERLHHAVKKLNNGKLVIDLLNPPSDEMETILTKMGSAFDLAYKRFQDLQKAEAQARESQIEVALERVRAKAMAMHSSEDLSQAVNTFFNELKILGLSMRRCGVGILDVETKTVDVHVTTETQTQDSKMMTGKLTLSGHPVLDQILETFKRQEEYHPVLRGKELSDYYKAMNPEVEYPDFADDDIQYGYYFHFKEGGVFTWTDKELTEANLQIFRRYTSVLSLTYRRYLELKEAEAQAREAQIEGALEKVRSRSLAMHKPDELQEVVAVVAEKLKELGVIYDAGGVILCTYFPDNKDVVHWIAVDDFSTSGRYFVPYFDNPIFSEAWDSKIKGDAYYFKEFPVEAKNEFFKHAFEHSDYRQMPDDYKQFVLQADSHNLSAAWSKNSAIIIPSLTGAIPSESDAEILKRFAKVFEQAYIRFMDLEKAEAQTREAQIETALEKVRSRTMAMQHSDELPEAANNLFLQVQELGIPAWSAGYCIWEEDSKTSASCNMSSEGEIQKAFSLPTIGEGYNFYDPYKKGETFHVSECGGKNLVKHYDFMKTLPTVGVILEELEKAGISLPTFQIFHIVYLKFGYVMFITYETVPDAHHIFKRFGQVFEQTYTRFLDLKLKEDQAVKLEEEKQRLEKTLKNLQQTQKQLIQSEKMASLGELTAGIAHEIQNPLNFVNNFSEVSKELLEEMLEEIEAGDMEEVRAIMADVVQNLDKINHHGKRADGIVKGMLQHSRASGDKKEPTNINALADEYLRLAYHGLRAKDKSFNAQLVTDFDKSITTVDVIPQDLGRVILNLLTNAFYAVNEKKKMGIENYEPTVSISTKKHNNSLEIEVTDNGNGIPHSVKEKIFQPFFTTKPTGQGTGLGLSMSYDIVTKGHGGELKIETKEGTTCRIFLPE